MFSLLVLSVSVAADATAVAIAASVRGITFTRGLVMALCFGAAQSVMAGIGWLGGLALGEQWEKWDHWIALVLLSGVGIKMIREAFTEDHGAEPFVASWSAILFLALATSIDALAVGVSLRTLDVPIAVALMLIGLVTFLLSAAGAAFGRFLGERFGRLIEVAGGAGLIAIGISIVVDHSR